MLTGDISLPATVLLPHPDKDTPIVVFVHGSGPNDRDETVGQNKPFLDLARLLFERGISSLRYDKRTYCYRRPCASIDEEVIDDAISAIHLAKTFSNRVYLLGHSLGAMLAPEIAHRSGELAGVILMATGARDLGSILREQIDYLTPSGASDSYKQSLYEDNVKKAPYLFEPQYQVEKAKGLSLPLLFLQGERDYQVKPSELQLWQEALSGKTNAAFRLYPKLNHLFFEGEGPSSPMEYSAEHHIPVYVADDITSFINHHDQ